MLVHGMRALRGLIYTIWNKHGMGYGICSWYSIWEYGKTTVCGMDCVDGMGREKHSIWYGTFAVWYHGTMSWMYYMAKFAWWYGMFQYIRSVRVEYVVRISSVTSLYIGHWKVSENISIADRQADRQICIYQNRDSVRQTENNNLAVLTSLSCCDLPVVFRYSLLSTCSFFPIEHASTSFLRARHLY